MVPAWPEKEFARKFSWGNDPRRRVSSDSWCSHRSSTAELTLKQGDYELASPCSPVDLPQTLLEPVLVRHATANGFKTRFNTTLQTWTEDPKTKLLHVTLFDNLSKITYQVKTKYLFGADGARSQVIRELDLPLSVKPGQGLAINVLVRADLSHLVDTRMSNLHWVMQPDIEHPSFGWMGIIRMVKPWYEWMFILLPEREFDRKTPVSQDEYLQRVKDFIGDDTPAEILDVSKWYINEIVAETYSCE